MITIPFVPDEMDKTIKSTFKGGNRYTGPWPVEPWVIETFGPGGLRFENGRWKLDLECRWVQLNGFIQFKFESDFIVDKLRKE